MSAKAESSLPLRGLQDVSVDLIDPNPGNPRLIFPQDEIERLAESIDQEGILVPVVLHPTGNGRYMLVDGERRYKCAQLLGLETVPAVVTEPKEPIETLIQMFNIHLIREPWRDMPTAWALAKLIDELKRLGDGSEPSTAELARRTGLSPERVQRLRHALELPREYQLYINEGTIPLNWFWELKRNVIDPMARQRPDLLEELDAERVQSAFVGKRLAGVITDTVSLRDVRPIINYSASERADQDGGGSVLDDTLRALVDDPDLTISEAYEDTVQIMVEADKLERSTENMLKSFDRLLRKVRNDAERDHVLSIGQAFVAKLETVLDRA